MVVPGVERVDTIKTKDGYEMKSIWCRNDIRDTSMMKLSTATGCGEDQPEIWRGAFTYPV